MATITPAVLQGGVQLGLTATVLYTAPANTKAVARRAVFTNVDSATQTFTVYVVRAGGSPGAANTVVSSYSLASGQAYISPELANLVLGPGDSIQALASKATSINAMVSGYTA